MQQAVSKREITKCKMEYKEQITKGVITTNQRFFRHIRSRKLVKEILLNIKKLKESKIPAHIIQK